MNKTIIIYDFDGTLTPYANPQYQILLDNGYDNQKVQDYLNYALKNNNNINEYQAYSSMYLSVLNNSGSLSDSKVALGANNLKYNNGVIEYFENLRQNNNIKHYIVSSGFEKYLYYTIIAKYFKKIYGTTFKYDQYNKIIGIAHLMTDLEKINAVKDIIKNSLDYQYIIYIGDGLTDIPVMKYIKQIGGVNIFICLDDLTKQHAMELQQLKVIDEFFPPDFSYGSPLYSYISNIISEKDK